MMMMAMHQRRIVITGLGAVTPLGLTARQSWQQLIAGKSGIARYELPPSTTTNTTTNTTTMQVTAGRVPRGFTLTSGTSSSSDDNNNGKRFSSAPLSLFIQYALSASQMALEDAGLLCTTLNGANTVNRDRFGVSIGSGIGGIEEAVTAVNRLNRRQQLSPFLVPRLLSNMAAGNVSIRYGLRGPNHSVSTACAAGAHSIGDAARLIKFGDADIMLAGGSEACIGQLAVTGFSRAKALSTAEWPDASQSSRPFDSQRDGFVIGEGAGVLVLEEYEHAIRRNAPVIYAELIGYGLAGDANHITAPPEDGHGAARCMRRALESCGMEPNQVDYINAHATSTPLGDRAELRAIKTVFGKHAVADQLAISSTKGSIGHLLGAAGAVEAIFSILAIHEKIIPPTLNLHQPDREAEGLNCVPLKAQSATRLSVALSNSFGFGGTNTSLLFRSIS